MRVARLTSRHSALAAVTSHSLPAPHFYTRNYVHFPLLLTNTLRTFAPGGTITLGIRCPRGTPTYRSVVCPRYE